MDAPGFTTLEDKDDDMKMTVRAPYIWFGPTCIFAHERED